MDERGGDRCELKRGVGGAGDKWHGTARRRSRKLPSSPFHCQPRTAACRARSFQPCICSYC
ncbi:hypothetical protein [Lysobacter gummosus]|uniref:hypothetical protein n=1 Tax=Lysobacter gummosus TaxID=262324 RepID=UPI0036255C8D